MGTSLSGLTPATTFDGLLKTSDNDAITSSLKTIGSGDGTDSCLQLSNSALQVNGNLNIGSVHQVYQDLNDLIIKGNSGSTYLKYYTNSGNNLTNQFGIGNYLKYGVVVGEQTLPTTGQMLRVKGSGATSATTSLLVQNSAGTELLKVTDNGAIDFGVLGIDFSNDGSGGTMSVAGDRYIRLASSLNTYSAFNAHVFKTFGSGGYSEAMRITGNTDQFVGIGETTPTARLHVKGAGNTDATTSLLVQNSDGTTLLSLNDEGDLIASQGDGIEVFRVDSVDRMLRINHSNHATIDFQYRGSIENNLIRADAQLNAVGFGAASPSARVVIKGSGATSATTSLLVQDSAGTDLLKVSDDGSVFIGSYEYFGYNNNNSIRFATGEYIQNVQGTTSSNKWSLRDSSTSYAFLQAFTKSRKVAINLNANNADTDVNAQLHVKGSGNDATTTSLLVQNSDGTDILKVKDDGVTTIQGNVDALGGDVAIFQNNTDPTNQFKINKKDNSNNIWHTGTTNTEIQYRDNIHFRFNHGGVTQMQLRNTGNLGLGIGGSNASARMHVKGSGATSATTSLLVENSAGTDLMSVTDDGKVKLGTSSSIVELNSGYNNRFQQNRLSFYSTNTNIRGINAGGQGLIVSKSTGTSDLYPTAILAVDSTTQGFLPPRMTGTQRDAIEEPASGLIIYNTTTNKAQCYNGTSWNDMF